MNWHPMAGRSRLDRRPGCSNLITFFFVSFVSFVFQSFAFLLQHERKRAPEGARFVEAMEQRRISLRL